MNVTETRTIAGLGALQPLPHPSTEDLDWISDISVVISDDFIFVNDDFQGDLGDWSLLYDTPEFIDLLIRGALGHSRGCVLGWPGQTASRTDDDRRWLAIPYAAARSSHSVASFPASWHRSELIIVQGDDRLLAVFQ